jgi:hypothetical protein
MSNRDPERRDRATVLVGLLCTLALHGGVAGFVWWNGHAHAETRVDGPSVFLDTQLVRFGKPRDLSFLPHKQGSVRPKVEDGLKVAKSADALPKLDDKQPEKPKEDALSKTHAELFKNLRDDDPPGVIDPGEGSLTGSKAGTATEAKGDPYILSLVDQIGSAWSVPTTIKEDELHGLSAEACLTIAEDGALVRYTLLKGSGNSQFDSSLEAALSTIKQLPAPPDRFRSVAQRGKLCPTFSRH